jgi:hypothetical protein
MLSPRSFTSLGIDGGNALAFCNDQGAEMSRMGFANPKITNLESDCGWRKKFGWGMGTNTGFEDCGILKQLLDVVRRFREPSQKTSMFLWFVFGEILLFSTYSSLSQRSKRDSHQIET